MTDAKFRVFICYAHENDKELEIVVNHLKRLNVEPFWSGALQAGSPFPNQIKEGIARAHLFLPILTTLANDRPWVHQEIGFALAANVPVLPLAVGNLPTGMAEELQAIKVGSDLTQLEKDLLKELSFAVIESAVMLGSSRAGALFEVAPLHEDRTRLLIESARWLLEHRRPARVRQSGAFTSFSLPDNHYSNDIWTVCEGVGPSRNLGLRRDLQLERQLLERLAVQSGCDLIIDPHIEYRQRGDAARRARLETLVNFLKSGKVEDVRAVVLESDPLSSRESNVETSTGNLLLLGDWFMAESITPSPGMGYLQTLGTWHAPTVMDRVMDFDRTFEELLSSRGASPLKQAVRKLEEVISNLPAAEARTSRSRQKTGRAPAKGRRTR